MRSLGEIYDHCRQVGLTDCQRHFSTMWGGRAESWFSSALAREDTRRISTEALLGFFMTLIDNQIGTKTNENPERHAAISMLRGEIWAELMHRMGR